jgi:hypothetical protein
MSEPSPTPGSKSSPTVECAWCDAVAVETYVSRTTGEELSFCADCDPIAPTRYEPEACAEHTAGCPPRRAA